MKNSYIRIKKTSLFSYKKVLIALLYLCSICILCGFLTTEIQEEIQWQNTWQAHATYDFEEIIEINEDGEEEIVYGISTPEQLAGMFCNNNVNADNHTTISTKSGATKYKLTNNVSLSGRTWSPAELPKYYTFEGNSFVISNIKTSISTPVQYLGFVTTNSGTIKDITFKDVKIDNGNTGYGNTTYVGCVCGINYAGGIIKNISVVGSSSIMGSSYDNADREVGGICGSNSGTIFRCYNYAKVAYGKHIGGIVGRSSTSGTIKNCFNYGTVSSNSDPCIRCGGIAGEVNGTITYCVNNGTVTGGTGSSECAAGGIVGYVSGSISNCENHGTVSGGSSLTPISYVGGIAGYASTSITDTLNMSSVSAYANYTNQYTYPGEENKNHITVYSDIGRFNMEMWLYFGGGSSYTHRYTRYAYAGGIVGFSYYTVKNSYSTGSISGGYDYDERSIAVKGVVDYANTDDYSKTYYAYRYHTFAKYYSGINGNRSVSTSNCYSISNYLSNIVSITSNSGTYTFNEASVLWVKIRRNMTYSISKSESTSGYATTISTYATASMNGTVENWSGGGTIGPYYVFNDSTTFYTYYNVYSSSSIKSMSASTLGSNWAKKSSVNGGYPYIAGLYW